MDIVAGMGMVAVLACVVWLFNRLVQDRNQVAAAWSDVDVQLQRRHDLVPNLVSAVKAYAGHERDTLQRVTEERSRSRAASTVEAKSRAETALESGLGRLVALAEAYPDLKASENFADLSRQLVVIEDHLQSARRFYNGSVRQYNDRQQQFPHWIIARLFGFQPGEFFAGGDGIAKAPEVDL
ncbi:LemA family protein [Luteimonas vadosa]